MRDSVPSLLGRKCCTLCHEKVPAGRLCLSVDEHPDPPVKSLRKSKAINQMVLRQKRLRPRAAVLVVSIYRHPHEEEVEETFFGQVAKVSSYIVTMGRLALLHSGKTIQLTTDHQIAFWTTLERISSFRRLEESNQTEAVTNLILSRKK